MARSIDLDNLDKDDLEYMSQREPLIREAELLGYDDIRSRIKSRNEETVDTSNTGDDNSDDEDEDEEEVDYSAASVADLKAELNARGLNSNGNKGDLVARLEEHDASQDEEEEEEEE